MPVESGRETGAIAGAEGSSDENRGSDRIWPIADTQATFGARDFAFVWPARALRVGALLLIASELTFLFLNLSSMPEAAPRTLPFHLLDIAVGAIVLVAAGSPGLIRHWRACALLILAVLMATANAIGRSCGQQEPVFLAVLLAVVGAGTCLPWSAAWQVSLELLGVVSLAGASFVVPTPFNQWLAIAVAIALAHWSKELSRRNRAELSNGLKTLDATQAALRAKVAELEQSERRARESEDVLRRVIESCPDPIAITRLSDGNYIDVNKASESAGYSTEETLGATSKSLGIFADIDDLRAYDRDLRERGVVRNMEVRFKRKDGVIVPCLISGAVVELNGEQCVVSFTREITRLKQVEQKVRESEAALRKIIETCPDVISINVLEDGIYTGVNQRFVEATGYSREEVLGKSALEVGIWADMSYREEFLRRLRADSVVRNMEIELRGKDGRRSPHLVSAVLTELGGKQSIISISRDVTEMKQVEQKVRESEAVLRKIIETSPDPMSINLIEDGRFTDMNRAFVEASGFSRDEALGRTLGELGMWVDMSNREELLGRLQAHSMVRNMEIDLRTKDGRRSSCLISAVVTELGGKPSVISISRDVTELKQAEQKVRESEAVLRKIIETCPDPMSINLLEDGKFSEINLAWVKATGYSREEALGKTVGELGVWADGSQHREFLKRLRSDSVVRNMEIEQRGKDGHCLPCLISAVVTELGGKPSVISTIRDITELKETQDQLEAAREAALAAARAKSEFLSSMSHEIRTPMNAVLGMAELLWDSPLSPEQRRYVNVMRANGDALVDLINDILDLAKIESGCLSLERVGFDLDDLVDKLGEMMGIRAHEKGLELALRIAPGVPTNLIGDPLRLRQILVNLLGNAIKFTERGEVVLSIERAKPADAAPAGGSRNGAGGEVRLRFSVKDTGIGIAKDKLGLIFTSFAQADPSIARTFGGTGLGLSISERLAELYGSKISVESEPGVGSCFSFTASLGVGTAKIKAARREELNLSGLRVLVVDDIEVNRLILKEILERKGAVISEARSGAEALAKVERAAAAAQPYQLIVLDCRMPGMDGIEVARVLKASHEGERREPPLVVMLTSDDLRITPALLGELGIHTYLVKPVRRAELLDVIGRALRNERVPEARRTDSPAAALAGAPSALRILLADDSRDNRLLVRAYMAKTGWELDEAKDGSAAIEKFKAGRYDLVLMDMLMPAMDGFAATKSIREWEQQNHLGRTPIIALTASALPETVHECLEAGCDSHVSKPVSRAMLFNAIRDAAAPKQANGSANGVKTVVTVEEGLRTLVPQFLEHKRAAIAEALEALQRGDCASALRVGHQLKGEGGAYGFWTLTELGKALEEAARSNDLEGASRRAGELADFLNHVEVEYRP